MHSLSPEGFIDNLTVIEDPEDTVWPLKMLLFDYVPTEAGDESEQTGIWAATKRCVRIVSAVQAELGPSSAMAASTTARILAVVDGAPLRPPCRRRFRRRRKRGTLCEREPLEPVERRGALVQPHLPFPAHHNHAEVGGHVRLVVLRTLAQPSRVVLVH